MGEQLNLAALGKIFIDKPLTRYTLAGRGLYVGSRLPDIHAALTSAELKSGEVFIDLGSGDGRVVCLAALLGARALGFEADRELHRRATERAETVIGHYQGSHGRLAIDLRFGDFLAHSVAGADVVFYYAGGAGQNQDEIYRKVCREMKAGARFVITRTQKIPCPEREYLPASAPPYYYIYQK